jgi:hypothetical protein
LLPARNKITSIAELVSIDTVGHAGFVRTSRIGFSFVGTNFYSLTTGQIKLR